MQNKVAHNLESESMLVAVCVCVTVFCAFFVKYVYSRGSPCAWEILGTLTGEADKHGKCIAVSIIIGELSSGYHLSRGWKGHKRFPILHAHKGIASINLLWLILWGTVVLIWENYILILFVGGMGQIKL